MAIKPGWDFGMARGSEREIGPLAGGGLQPFTRTTYRAPTAVARGTPAAGGGGGRSAAYEEALAALQRAKALYEPGGGYGKGVEAAIARGRKKAVSVGAQELVGAHLAGTTMVGGLGTRYEEEVGMPARMGVEEERARALANLEVTGAGMQFQAGEAGAQRRFQAAQAFYERQEAMQRLQMQIDAQERASMFQMPTISPTARTGDYARQFPSIYGETGQTAPSLTGETADLSAIKMAPFGGAFYGTGEAFETYGLEPPTGSVPMGRRFGPTIEEPAVTPAIGGNNIMPLYSQAIERLSMNQ